MSFRDALASGKFLITAEVGPPKGTDIEEMLHHAKAFVGLVDGVNVTDNQSSVMRLGSLAVSHLLTDLGLDPVFQLTCRDRNRMALQTDLLNAWVLGIKNVLSLTGDYVSAGDHKEAMPVFDLESVQLLGVIDGLNEGHDLVGNELQGKTDFLMGAVVTPEANPLEPQLIKFAQKVEAGAKFFQTQAVYDMEHFHKFMEQARPLAGEAKIMAGILLLKSAGMARFLNNFVPGINVPQHLIDELKAAEKPLQKGIEIAARQIKELKNSCDGVHIMAIGLEDRVPQIIELAGLK